DRAGRDIVGSQEVDRTVDGVVDASTARKAERPCECLREDVARLRRLSEDPRATVERDDADPFARRRACHERPRGSKGRACGGAAHAVTGVDQQNDAETPIDGLDGFERNRPDSPSVLEY